MIKLPSTYPNKLGIRFCNEHKVSCSLIVIVTPDHTVDKSFSTFREFFCVDCKRVLSSDETYTDYIEVMNERLNADIT